MLRARRSRTLQIERLEDRSVMAGVPALNSLIGATNSIYLDFDGHVEPLWRNTDSSQRDYFNVFSGGYDRDGVAGLSNVEVENIKKIWNIVAEDFAPFNVNVTTVEPAANAPNTLRVVIAGQNYAQYPDQGQLKWSGGFNFIIKADGTKDDGSGIASIGSFTNSQPNTVYVFADAVFQDNVRLSPEHIGNTAAHEAGHAFGLVHHQRVSMFGGFANVANGDEYEPGNGIVTPIMGNNLVAGTAHKWSTATYAQAGQLRTQDGVAVLRNVLGSRPDEAGGNYATAREFVFSNTTRDPRTLETIRSGRVQAVVSALADSDAYRFRTNGGTFSITATPVIDGNLDVAMVLVKVDRVIRVVGGVRQTITIESRVATIDPAAMNSAGWSGKLAAGDYYVRVGSHGSYGDLGYYDLAIRERTPITVPKPLGISASGASALADLAFAGMVNETQPVKRTR